MQPERAVRAVLLAAGQGKRMKSTRAKVLHDVLGYPILARVLSAVQALSIEHIHVVVGHAADQVNAFLKTTQLTAPYSTHMQEPQLGTGHALMQVEPSLEGFSGTLLISVADAPLLTGKTLQALVEGHHRSGAAISVLSTIVEDPKSYGRVLRSPEGNVQAIIEDKDADEQQRRIREVNTAIYCLEWPAMKPGLAGLSNNNQQQEYYLTDLIGWAVEKGMKVSAVVAPDWREVAGINSRVELAEATRLLRDITLHRLALEDGVTVVDPSSTWVAPEVRIGQDSIVLPGCCLTGDIQIGSFCVIGPNTVLTGPVTIGNHTTVVQSNVSKSVIGDACRVGPFAHMRDGNKISDHVRIGNFVEIKNTDIDDHSNVSHLSYVGDGTIGREVNVGAGTITANYDHISKAKQRTVIRDRASTGSNSVLVAPIQVGEGAMVGAGTVATKDVPGGALAVGRARQENKEGWADNKRKRQETKKQEQITVKL